MGSRRRGQSEDPILAGPRHSCTQLIRTVSDHFHAPPHRGRAFFRRAHDGRFPPGLHSRTVTASSASYGVIAYSVSQRKREIGIRMALGAQRHELTGMFVRHGFGLTIAGLACGLPAALVLMGLMSSLLFGVGFVDPVTYGAVSAGLVATAALASYLPSRRVAAVNPVEALRAE